MIVVGYDGSACGWAALHWALADAAAAGDTVTVVRAWTGGSRTRRDGERLALEREVAAALRETPAQATAMLVEGDPATALLDVARDTAAATVVVGTAGRGRLASFGSVSRRCVAFADRTVVLVPPGPQRDHGVVVVGADDTVESVAAVRWAAAEAAVRRARLVAVHAYEGIAWGNDAAVAAWARERLDAVLDKADVPGAERVTVEDDVLPALRAAARDADLLVLGGVPRGLLSSPADVPVAVVRETWRTR